MSLREDQIVWMVGSPRSGTTWIVSLLGMQREVSVINEPLIGLHLACPTRAAFGNVPELSTAQPRLVDRFDQTPDYFFSDAYRGAWLPALRDLVLARFGAQADGLVVIKEPNGSEGIDVLRSAMPSSRVLAVVRDGRDVVDSMLDAVQGGWASTEALAHLAAEDRGSFIRGYAELWVQRIRVVLDSLGDGLLVRYEDALADTAGELRRIYRWMGVETPADLESHVAAMNFGTVAEEWRGPGRFHRAASPGLWRERFSQDERAELDEVMGPELAELGYDL